MKRRDLLLGGALAVLLAAGVLLVRGLGGAGAGDGPVGLDLTQADGELAIDDLTVSVTAGPRPLRVFARLRFAFRFLRGGEAIEIEEPHIDFDMTMDMGPHGYRLAPDAEGAWVADGVVLPQCGSGSRLWFGKLTFVAEGRPRSARLRLELEPPRGD